jgi:hypothetical protein
MHSPSSYQHNAYFEYRNVNPDFYLDYRLPNYISKVLPKDKGTKILDTGF